MHTFDGEELMAVNYGEAFLNVYRHDECGSHWADVWSCGCNDRCPECNAEIEPYMSLEVSDIASTFRLKRRRHSS